MATANLHTLDSDVLCELLTSCSDLTTLRCLIATHPRVYYAFSSRRSLILRFVFRNQNPVLAAAEYVIKYKCKNPLDCVAFREALWPQISRRWPSQNAVEWATALLTAYHKAGLKEDAISFAKGSTILLMNSKESLTLPVRTFARAIVRTYVAAEMSGESIALQDAVRQRLDPKQPEHSYWCKESVATFRNIGELERVLQLQQEFWEIYKTRVGPGSDVALDWARTIVKELLGRGKDKEALQFHQKVRSELDPTTLPYIAWSRQLIHMLQRDKKDAEALVVTEEVWRHLNPEAAGYRAWTKQLSDQYEAMGRPKEAIAVCEASWTAATERLSRSPKSSAWKYAARGAGLALARIYRRHGRHEIASSVEEKCKAIES
jgi:hypothetical protein